MTIRGRIWRGVGVAVSVFSILAPPSVWSAARPLGTARGVRAAKLSFDGGKSWLAIGAGSLPVLEGTDIQSTSGVVVLDLADRSRITVLPFSALRITDSGRATKISVVYGRLAFRLPEQTRVEILTPAARLEPLRRQGMAGEVFVSGTGMMGLKMTEGNLQVVQLSDARRVLLASGEPVFLPKRPAVPGSFFSPEAPVAIPVGAKGVFTPGGESIGYLGPDGGFVIHPGFTTNLTRPFAPKLVQVAMATIPDQDRRDDAMPLFDVNGGYVGYIAGPIFHAQTQVAQSQPTPGGATAPEEETILGLEPWQAVGLGIVAVAGIGVGIAAGAGAFSSGGGGHAAPPPATP